MVNSVRLTLVGLLVACITTATVTAQDSVESKKKAWFEKVLNDHAFSPSSNREPNAGDADTNLSETRLPPVSAEPADEVRPPALTSGFMAVEPISREPASDGVLVADAPVPQDTMFHQGGHLHQPVSWNDPGAGLEQGTPAVTPRQMSFDPIAAEPQMLAASHQIANTGREMLDAGRAMIDSRPSTAESAEGGTALSNYYGHVTVNYYVSPDGKQPIARPASYRQDMDPFSDDEVVSELIGPPHAAYPIYDGPPPCGCVPCCKPLQSHCLGVFGEALYLRPGNLDVIYATEQIGCDPATATPTGPLGIANLDSEPGFRAGITIPLSTCASLVATYTWFQADTNSTINAQNGTVLGSRVLHPSIENCGINSTSASAKFDVDFQMMDLDYRRLLWRDCNWGVNYIAGVRYGRLTQEFESSQIAGAATGLAHVTSDIDFDGIGIRLGLDGERHSTHTGLFIYGRGIVSMLGGEYQANYLQTNQFDPTANIAVQYEDYRLSTILEGELGVGWQSCAGRVRLSLGYMGIGWHNALLTGAFIDGIANRGQFTETNDDFLTFDGLVGRIEFRH